MTSLGAWQSARRIAQDSRDTSEIRAYHTVSRTSARSAWLTRRKEQTMIRWIDKLLYKARKRRFCKLNRWFCPDCIYHDFIFEGAIFKGNNCRFPRKGADALERLVKTEPQKKEVEWVYNKRERLWYPYLDGELLFKTENSSEKPNSLE